MTDRKKELIFATVIYFVTMITLLTAVYRFLETWHLSELNIFIAGALVLLVAIGWGYVLSSLIFAPKKQMEDTLTSLINDIIHDITIVLKENKKNESIDGDFIRAVVVLAQMNLHIWHNESNYRKGIKEGNNLELTHGLNGLRNVAKNKIQEIVGGRKDYKTDCLAAEFKDWEISW